MGMGCGGGGGDERACMKEAFVSHPICSGEMCAISPILERGDNLVGLNFGSGQNCSAKDKHVSFVFVLGFRKSKIYLKMTFELFLHYNQIFLQMSGK